MVTHDHVWVTGKVVAGPSCDGTAFTICAICGCFPPNEETAIRQTNAQTRDAGGVRSSNRESLTSNRESRIGELN